MITIKQFCDAQAQRERERYESEQAKFVWQSVRVEYCHDQGEWIVYGHFPRDQEKRPEVISTARLKADAIVDAQLYAFDTSAGPQRAPVVYTYGKRGQVLDSFTMNRGRVVKL